MQEKINQSFFARNREISRILIDAVRDGLLIPYHSDSLKRRMTKEEFEEAIDFILENRKERKFTESIELQIGLKDYDPKKDKRFSGAIRLPFLCKTKVKCCVIGDVQHMEEAQGLGIDTTHVDEHKQKINGN